MNKLTKSHIGRDVVVVGFALFAIGTVREPRRVKAPDGISGDF